MFQCIMYHIVFTQPEYYISNILHRLKSNKYSIFYNIPKIKKQRIKVLLFQEKVSFLLQENQDHKGQIA